MIRVMRISAKADYAVRATIALAAQDGDKPVKAERIATEQEIPLNFLENILNQLKAGGIVTSQRGPEGGSRLARPAGEISLAEVIRAVEGPLASVRGETPESLTLGGSSESLQTVWIALRASLRDVLERVTVADVACGELPDRVLELSRDPDAWQRR